MKKYIAFIVCLVIMTGCEDYFDKEPLGNPVTDEFYGSLNELQLGLNAVYNVMADNTWQKCEWLFGSGPSDEVNRCENVSRFSPEGEIMQLSYTPENIWLLNRWKTNYRGVFRANWVIANADKVKIYEENLDAVNDQLDILGQAKMLRAFFYFNLVKTFGGVPIKPEVLSIDGGLDENGDVSDDNFIQQRNTVEEVYEYIEKDLREAILLLRPSIDFSNAIGEASKITRGSALGMLVKVLAYQAKPGISDPQWSEILDFTDHLVNAVPVSVEEVLNMDELYPDESLEEISARLLFRETLDPGTLYTNSYSYSLSDDYDLLWHQEGEDVAEWMFYVNHRETPDGSADVGSGFSEDLCGWSGYTANAIQPSEYLLGLEGGSDPRLKTSVIVQERVIYIGTYNGVIYTERLGGGHPGPTKTHCHKWSTLDFERPLRSADNGKNFRIMRFAEILLFHAEALNETGDPKTPIDLLNALRARARKISQDRWVDINTQAVNDLQYGTYPEVRDKIWRERQIELNCEFDRFWDIVRTGRAKKEINAMNSKVGEPAFTVNFIPGVHEIFAIPQNEIDLSNGVITQNPGY